MHWVENRTRVSRLPSTRREGRVASPWLEVVEAEEEEEEVVLVAAAAADQEGEGEGVAATTRSLGQASTRFC